ncbi:proline and serine-rich protein 3 [Tiliqua scincoides]|uniref:proline and serine-rich protein 3 n=1 Tax=Tiliqua scincoides TaxID=71010 RepID=UPI0034634F94
MDSKYESCLAVFSTQGSPFLKAANSRSHYHPSHAQLLSPEQRHMVLSPSRLQARTLPVPSKKTETLSPPCLGFLPDSSDQGVQAPNSDSTSPFSESWPSTERSSSSLTPKGGNAVPTSQVSETKAPASPKLQESASGRESVIARYIERFRYGQPTNRQERWASSGHFPTLWWLDRSFSPEGNLSEKESRLSSDSGKSETRPSPLSSAPDQSPSGESHETSNWILDTANLQERAARLLHRSASPSSNTKHISSEGLSFTSTVTNAEMDTTGSAPQHLTWHQRKDSLGAVPDRIAQTGSSLKPEDDILFQWRLRRKMEEASKAAAVLPPASWRNQFTLPTCALNMVEGATLKLPEATTWGSNGRTLLVTGADVKSTHGEHWGSNDRTSPASGADVKSTHGEHPCCCTDSMRTAPSSRQPTETTRFTTRNGMVESPEPNRERRVEEPTPQGSLVPMFLDSSPQPRPTETRRPSDRSTLHHAQRTTQPVEKSITHPRGSQRSFLSEQDRAKPVRGFREPLVSPPKSSIQRALGEVIAERLFSSPEPPAPHKGERQKSTKNLSLEEAAPQTVISPSHPQLLSMAAQLLEQAEDSDGMEFEDDPLLQVLRGQREFVRNQLRAVDAQVTQLEGYHSDLDSSHQ